MNATIKVLALATALAGALPAAAQMIGDDAAACQAGGKGTALLVTVDGFANRGGTIRAEVYPAAKADWLKDDRDLLAEGKFFARAEGRVPLSGPARLCVRLPGPGDYAVGVFHSTDGVRKFNVKQHGVGFANNPRLGWSQPEVTRATITAGNGLTETRVTLNYLRGLAMRPLVPPVPAAEATRMADRR
jgi:uncharacterized protein (DUF2141 family)